MPKLGRVTVTNHPSHPVQEPITQGLSITPRRQILDHHDERFLLKMQCMDIIMFQEWHECGELLLLNFQ